MELELDADRYYWVSGPAKLMVYKGKISINGIELDSGKQVVIRKEKSIIFRTIEKTQIRYETMEEGILREAEKEEEKIIQEWETKTDDITRKCEEKNCITLVLGDIEAGKTTFTTLLANKLLSKKLSVYIVDTDVGQSSIGLPGFVTSTIYKTPQIWYSDLYPQYSYFVGSITPTGYEERVIGGVISIVERVIKENEKANIIIDTDGWFSWPQGIAFKAELMKRLNPDFTVVLDEKKSHIQKYFTKIGGDTNLVFLSSPPIKKKRGRMERQFIRGEKIIISYKKQKRKFSLTETPLTGRYTLGFGEIIGEEDLKSFSKELGARILYGEKIDEETFLLYKGYVRNRLPGTRLLNWNSLDKRIVGLIDSKGDNVGSGIIVGFDEKRKQIIVETDFTGHVNYIVVGDIVYDGKTIRLASH